MQGVSVDSDKIFSCPAHSATSAFYPTTLLPLIPKRGVFRVVFNSKFVRDFLKMSSKRIKRVGHVSLSFSLRNQNEVILIFGGYVEVTLMAISKNEKFKGSL